MDKIEDNLTSAVLMFNWMEYTVFGSMLFLSLLIGVYYGWFKKQDTVAEYMLGGKKMGVFPITMSMIASHISGVTLLGVPAEIYSYGTQMWSLSFCVVAIYFITTKMYLPVFYHLQMNSLYEYLELRFSSGTRTIASLIFALYLIIFIPIVIYVPALAFNQVTGISVPMVTLVISLICIFYTLFGGLKAVVWTDTLQSVFTLGSTIFVVILGYYNVGSFSKVLEIAENGKRLEFFNMNPSLFQRGTFWAYSIGSTFQWIASLPAHPGAMQRFIAVSTFKEAKQVMFWSCVGFAVINVLVALIGLFMYASFYNCDPVAAGVVQKTGQVIPYYVMGLSKDYPGLTGLFISGVVSAALSTMSAGLNTVAGTLYEDFVMYVHKGEKLSESKQNYITKIIVLLLGIICMFLVTIVEKLGTILEVCLSLSGVTNGALAGVFTLGVLFPRANSKGAIAGTLTCLFVMTFIVFQSQLFIIHGLLKLPGKVTRVDGCPANLTDLPGYNASDRVDTYTGVGSPVIADDSVSLIYQLSFFYYTMIGIFIVLVVGLAISYLTEPVDPKTLNPKLFTPYIQQLLPQKQYVPPLEEYKMVLSESTLIEDRSKNKNDIKEHV